LAIIAAATAVVAVAAVDLYSYYRNPPQPAEASGSQKTRSLFRAGAAAPAVAGVDYGGADRTLVLLLSVHCRYCEMSSPFYRDIADRIKGTMEQGGEAKLQLVAIFPQNEDEVAEYAAREHLSIRSVPDVPLTRLGVSSTPTELLVDSNGIIVEAWTGAPGEDARAAIISRVFRDAK